ncbi:hypothetical protein PZA11_003892 [Diplocarpon coronariae]|uniref:Uncharacterized protein n=1 Tax=Diplocarpon coronariae TaxID=2795749 RepID=A0A218ZFE2_9HELO|nr:hypothetical protein B2J93_8846 [Marssonina coronariae]
MKSVHALLVLSFSSACLAALSSAVPQPTRVPGTCGAPWDYPPIQKANLLDCFDPAWDEELLRQCKLANWDSTTGTGEVRDPAGNLLYCETKCCMTG